MQTHEILASLKFASTMLMDANNGLSLEQTRDLGVALAAAAKSIDKEILKREVQPQAAA